jgi:hypothetical protein
VAALVPLATLEADPAVALGPSAVGPHADPTIVTVDVPLDTASPGSPLRSLYDSIAGSVHERWTALTAATHERVVAAGDRLHQATELAAAQKAAAVAASAVALTGGAVAGDHRDEHDSARASGIEREASSRSSTAFDPSVISQRGPFPPGSDGAPLGSATDGSNPAPAPVAQAVPAGAPVEFGPELSPPGAATGSPSPGAAPARTEPAESPPAPSPPTSTLPAGPQPEPGTFER